jgi:hypothetical protein
MIIKLASKDRAATGPWSNRAGISKGLYALFGLFALMGGVLLYFLFVAPLLKISAARSWPATPCIIVSSTVQAHHGSHGSTYSIEVVFAYTVGGQSYTSDRYSFFTGSSSGRESKVKVVAGLPPGLATVCYANPVRADEAVLERGYTSELWFGLIPLAFLLIGLGGIVGVTVAARRRGAPTGLERTAIGLPPAAMLATDGPVTLKPRQSPAGVLMASVVFAVLWNGLVAVFIFAQFIPNWRQGHPDYFLAVFLIPFVLVGLGVIVWVGYNLLALGNPRPVVTLGRGRLHPGEEVEVDWEFIGDASRLIRLIITVEGREEATYQAGKNTRTDRHVFATIPVIDAREPVDIAAGRARFAIPAGAMHSFKSDHNQVIWQMAVKGEIPRWPDVKTDLEVIVSPRPVVAGVPT